MSYTGFFSARYDDAAQAVNDLAVSPDSDAPEQVGQVAALKEAAVGLIKSGVVVNDASQDLYVSVGGHANPDHKPRDGFGNDMVTLTISQVTRQPTDA